MGRKQIYIGFLMSALVGALVAISSRYLIDDPDQQQQDKIKAANTFEQKQAIGTSSGPEVKMVNGATMPGAAVDFTVAAESSTPGVVHIKTFREVASVYHNDPYDQMMREFFGDPYGGRIPQQPQGPQEAGSGSGVILSSDGYIATNNHVVKSADKVEVVLYDKRRYEAEVIGVDPTTDLALLKVDADELTFIPYGNSDNVKIGEWVMAVGNPFDLTSTVTAGIVSAKARNINILRHKENLAIESFIQTDAAVNPGNSGGALVNLNGELIGINTAIATPTGTYAGYSFAVPVNLVKKVMNDLLNYGEVQRALLGISIQDVTAELAEEYELGDIEGVYVAGVREDGAADLAGVKKGDVILKINGVDVNTSSELQEIVARYRPGIKS